jgi:2-(1,2-epoxy-1,2-dihydrophenyl)acetyl-CoA isomerase
MDYEKLIVTKKDGVGIIRMNSPQNMNALESRLVEELLIVIKDMEVDNGIGAVILTGADKAFCAGGDLDKLARGFSSDEGYTYMKGFADLVRGLTNIQKPLIAAVNGFAVGAGFCIAMLTDIIIASERAKFGMAFVNVGLIPDLAGTYTLPRLIGVHRAKELVFSGRMIDAEEARFMGIANRVVAADELDSIALEIAASFASGPRIAIKFAKLLLNASGNLTMDQLLEIESATQAQCFQSEDHKIALKAFFAKEKPVFVGK